MHAIPFPTRFIRRGATFAVMTWVSTVGAQVSFEEVKAAELETLAAGAAAQQRVEQLDDQRADLAHQYRGALRQLDELNTYHGHLRALITNQEQQAASLRQQIDDIAHLEQDMVPLMVDMLSTLEQFIALDLPFLLDERRQRVDKLRGLMHDANVSNSEKYRRILEAYQIENDYGRTIEAYDGTLNSGNQEQRVTFLKIGRVALLYQTPDAEQSFRWEVKTQSWQPLNRRDNQAVRQGIRMAREQITSDLLLLPIEIPMQF